MNAYLPTVALAINRAVVGKIPPEDWWRHANKWERVTMTPAQLCRMAVDPERGYAWTCDIRQDSGGRRKTSTFASIQLLGLDFDGASMESVIDRFPLAAGHGSFAYESPSCTPENPRCRLVFCMGRPLEFEPATALLKALYWHFHDADADEKTKDPTRLWYGAPGKRWLARWGVLDLATASLLQSQYDAAHRASPAPAVCLDLERSGNVPWRWRSSFERALRKVRNAGPNSRNSTLYGQARILFEWANSGALTTDDAEEWLFTAAKATGLPESEILRAIANAKAKTGSAKRTVHGNPLEVKW